jgi:hypothetical protein
MDWLAELRRAADGRSLGDLVAQVRRKAQVRRVAVVPYSKGTWSRILNGEQPVRYPHQVQIALLRDLPLPDPPPQEAAKGVDAWEVVGDGPPRFGVLLAEGGDVRFTPKAEAEGVQVRLVRARTRPRSGEGRGDRVTIRVSEISVLERNLERGHAGQPDAIRAAAQRAAAALEEGQDGG